MLIFFIGESKIFQRMGVKIRYVGTSEQKSTYLCMESVTKINFKRKNLIQHIGTALMYVDYGISCPCGNLCRRTKMKNSNNKSKLRMVWTFPVILLPWVLLPLFQKKLHS